jgi:hypothetical protein
MSHEQPSKKFDATQSADLPAALYVRSALQYMEHATRPIVPSDRELQRTVCGKRIKESNSDPGWMLSAETFREKANIFAWSHLRTGTILPVSVHISGTCCEECIRQVFGYVKCIDCPVDYLATPMIYPNWIKSTRRASRCETHQRQYDSTASEGEKESDEYVIVVHNENRKENIQLTAHVASRPVFMNSMEWHDTLCGTRMHKKLQYSRRGFLLDPGSVIRYAPRNLESFRTHKLHNVCKRCETMMRERGYATRLPSRTGTQSSDNSTLAIVGIP